MATDIISKASVPVGTRFGRYEVITEIASGGMATVFLGRALGAAGFQRLVAVKLLHPHIARDEDFVNMFMDEARLAARIRHPNVVPTLDLENGDDGLFLVMEFVEGDGLLSLMKSVMRAGKKLPAPVTVRIILDVLAGLHAAHELTDDRGEPLRLVHRDISPHNILVGIDGIARITDFGIARAEERLGTTRDGQIKGKLAYMAPEQTNGSTLDRRVDVFATGVVLWECLTGKRLFYGQSDAEVLRKLLVNPIPRLREVDPDLPEALEEVVHRALDRDPENRYSTAAQFADALEHAGGSVGIGSTRAVAKYVRESSGEKVAALQGQVRQVLGDSSGSLPLRPRAITLTDPERTNRLSHPPGGSLEALRVSSPGTLQPTTVPPQVPKPAASGSSRWLFLGLGVLTVIAASATAVFVVMSKRPQNNMQVGAPVRVGSDQPQTQSATAQPPVAAVQPPAIEPRTQPAGTTTTVATPTPPTTTASAKAEADAGAAQTTPEVDATPETQPTVAANVNRPTGRPTGRKPPQRTNTTGRTSTQTNTNNTTGNTGSNSSYTPESM